MGPRRGAYPGSFNPLTVAHVAIARAALDQRHLDRVDLIVSRVALAKEDVDRPRLEDRVEVLTTAAATRPWLGVVVTDHQLLADIAEGYDLLVLGSDKWMQIQDPAFYGGTTSARDAALARLPELAIAPRPSSGSLKPLGREVLLELDDDLIAVSSTGARGARRDWMAPEALAFDEETGAWSDPHRYEMWIRSRYDSKDVP